MKHAGPLIRSTAAAFLVAGLSLCGMAVVGVTPGAARPLASIEARGIIVLCAHPNALPFASRRDEPPGFQIELARALAKQLGVELDVAWVFSPIHYRRADCDIVMDTIIEPAVQAERRMQVSKPYHRSGVALALPASARDITSFAALGNERRIGVQTGSMAQMVLGKRGVPTTPFYFEDEILEAVADGTIGGAAVSPAAVGYYNLRHPGQKVRLVHAYEHEPELSWVVAVGMRGADSPLRQKIDMAIDRMLTDGTIREIYARYGVEHRPPANSR